MSAAEEIHSMKSAGLQPAELEFFARSTAKGMKLLRNGWPDFLVEDEGKTIAVEVKSKSDRISKDQKLMFSALEKAGIRVYIWWERFPDRLMPWKHMKSALKKARAEKAQVEVERLRRLVLKLNGEAGFRGPDKL